ncbi:methionine aminopeptidase [Actinorhabdospora filicis]|uniref:Methionine aminopeptidase n=1 Tax=Actinorhabdospora filicis TaxID=1785913 RepID=A0A9W6SIX3_9ACTN|nr:type I methionyl aminopeptidase [Actinorhabdospora filicis]GLZ76797.1 methionine aminopeptidase [Actinorhabdospora filicis]
MGWRREHIEIKTPEQIGLMRKAGLVVAAVHEAMREATRPGVSTKRLDTIAETVIRDHGAIPSFLGYDLGDGAYPASICSSVNEQVVHAIPTEAQVLREGDLISIDVGAILDGWHGDAAITLPVGEVEQKLLDMVTAAEDALWAGIAAARVGGRLTDISHAVETAVDAAGEYGIVEGYGGHGIGTEMHMDPHILNYGDPGRGVKLKSGMALAIEPMITMGSSETVELDDAWTVVTDDGSFAAHVEHTIGLCADGVWVLTAPDGGVARLGELVTARAR